jgi:hypothetical protein
MIHAGNREHTHELGRPTLIDLVQLLVPVNGIVHRKDRIAHTMNDHKLPVARLKARQIGGVGHEVTAD